jgi:hypothetical protein
MRPVTERGQRPDQDLLVDPAQSGQQLPADRVQHHLGILARTGLVPRPRT